VSPPPDLEPYERLVAFVGPSPFGLVWPAVRLVLVIGFLGFCWARVAPGTESAGWFAQVLGFVIPALLLWLGYRWGVRPWWRWSGQWCALTTHRLLIGSGRRAHWSIPYGMITSVIARGALPRWLTGTMQLTVFTTMREYPATFRWLDRRSLVPAGIELARRGAPFSAARPASSSDERPHGTGR